MVLIKLEDGTMAQCYYSDNDPWSDGCDSALGYELYNADGESIDGGEYDFNSEKNKHVLDDLVKLITGNPSAKYEIIIDTDDCCYGSIMELVAEEFDTSFKTMFLINKLDSEVLKNKIRELCKKMRR